MTSLRASSHRLGVGLSTSIPGEVDRHNTVGKPDTVLCDGNLPLIFGLCVGEQDTEMLIAMNARGAIRARDAEEWQRRDAPREVDDEPPILRCRW